MLKVCFRMCIGKIFRKVDYILAFFFFLFFERFGFGWTSNHAKLKKIRNCYRILW